MLKGIKNIIFDFGVVIINLDYHRTTKAFKAIGINDFNSLYSHAMQSDLFDQLEMGTIPYDAFRDEVRKYTTQQITNQQIDDAWNAMLLDIPLERLHLLEKLKSKYRTFLLSNTNIRHYQHYTTYIQHAYGISGMEPFFERTYFSHQVGMRKPNQDIFLHALQENHLNPSETLFIDDTERHINGAKSVGLQTHWLLSGEDIVHLFAEHI